MAWLAQMCFDFVKVLEQWVEIRIIRFLCGGKASLVDTVVDFVVDPFVHSINFGAQVLRVESAARLVDLAKVLGEQVVKFAIEHADDFAGLVVDNSLLFLVPQARYSIATVIVRVCFKVELFKRAEAVSIQNVSQWLFSARTLPTTDLLLWTWSQAGRKKATLL